MKFRVSEYFSLGVSAKAVTGQSISIMHRVSRMLKIRFFIIFPLFLLLRTPQKRNLFIGRFA